jgi:hypothetical protein
MPLSQDAVSDGSRGAFGGVVSRTLHLHRRSVSHCALEHLFDFSFLVCALQLLCNIATCAPAASGIAEQSHGIVNI